MKTAYWILLLAALCTVVIPKATARDEKGPNEEDRGTQVATTDTRMIPDDANEPSDTAKFGGKDSEDIQGAGERLHESPGQRASISCESDDCEMVDADSSTGIEKQNRIRSFIEHDVLDAAFSLVYGMNQGNACLVPGLDTLCSVLHKDNFCWVSSDGEECTLSEGHVASEDGITQDDETKQKGELEDDEQGKPEVQQITQKVLEVLPEAAKVNFALSRDGAKVLASNQGAKRVGAILDDDSDTFMRNDCKDNKWVVIELSQVARVSSLEISQNELYSSRLKEFAVYGMQSHPRTLATLESSANVDSNGWSFMGKFEGKKSKGVQSFGVDSSRWVRYLLIRFLTHHGTENVCAINEIAVYGTSAAEELEAQLAHDELVFDSIKEEVTKEEVNLTSLESAVPRGQKGNNTTGLPHVENNLTDQSKRILVIFNDTAISNMQKIISQNLFSYAASNHSSSSISRSPVCMQEVPESSTVHTVKKNVTVVKVVKDKVPILPAPPPSADDLVPIPKPKTGGNLYETLIQELRATKAQQKMISKSLESMHKNVEIVAEELASLRKSSGLLGSFEVQQKIDQLELKLYRITRNFSHQSNAATTLFAAVMASIILQLEMFNVPSKRSILMDIAKGLVALNVFVGGALILKGTFTAS